jgi:hypothetical protein
MKSDKILIVTSLDDAHADYIINILNERGLREKVIRLNTENFIDNCIVSFTESNVEIEIKDSKRAIKLDEICSVWFRRPKDFLIQHNDERVSTFINKQSMSLLRGIYFATHDSAKCNTVFTSWLFLGLGKCILPTTFVLSGKLFGFDAATKANTQPL